MLHALPSHLPSFIQSIAPTVNRYGYIAVGGLVMLEDFGVPVPGETILITAAVFAGLGRLNILVVILIAFIAAVIGDNIGFAIGNLGGRPLIERFGKYIFLTPARLDKAEAFFSRNGSKVIVVARFIEGLRQANGIVAGISDMRWSIFIIYNAIGAACWVGLWSTVGYFGGSHIATFLRFDLYLTIVTILTIIAFILVKVVKQKRRKDR